MLYPLILLASALVVALSEFFLHPKEDKAKKQLQSVKVLAAISVFIVGILILVEPLRLEQAAKNYKAQGLFSEALALYKQMETADAENADLLLKIGDAYNAIGSDNQVAPLREYFLGQAVHYYYRAAGFEPRRIDPYLSIMGAYESQKDAENYTALYLYLRKNLKRENYFVNGKREQIDKQNLGHAYKILADYALISYTCGTSNIKSKRSSCKKLYKKARETLNINCDKEFLELASMHISTAKELAGNSSAILAMASQFEYRIFRDYGDKKYLQNAYDIAIELSDIDEPINRAGVSERLIIHMLLNSRANEINTHGITIDKITKQLDEKVQSFSPSNSGYLTEFSKNARYLFAAYCKIENWEKAKEWHSKWKNAPKNVNNQKIISLCNKNQILSS